MPESPFLAMKQVETHIRTLLRDVDIHELAVDKKKAVTRLRRLSMEVRLDIRDYELSETRTEQLVKLQVARRQITQVQASLLSIGDMLSPADVAHLSAQLEYINGRLI